MTSDQVLALDLDRPRADLPPPPSNSPTLSHFEFWPAQLFYLPVKIYGAWLGLRYGGWTLPTVANPLFDVGGFVGESKDQILRQIPDSLGDLKVPHVAIQRSAPGEDALTADLGRAVKAVEAAGLDYPLVAKPDFGARGAGVQRLFSTADLRRYLGQFPLNEKIILQPLFDYPAEAGVFYVRHPQESRGRIFSLTLKSFPEVVGDGQRSLRELIESDARAAAIAHIYLDRHRERLHWVLPAGQRFRIAFAGSHSRGSIFRNGAALITPAMEAAWDAVAKQIPEFYFGRFDVRFRTVGELQQAKGVKIIEVNGAGAEATHIWDARTRLGEAYATLFAQYRLVFQIGAANRRRGFRPMPFWQLVRLIQENKRQVTLYPLTH